MVHKYNRDSFSLFDIEKAFKELWNNKPKERTMRLYSSADNIEFMKATMSGDKKKIAELSKKIDERIAISQAEYKAKFIAEYGNELYEFMCSIMPKNWLKSEPYYNIDSWDYICENEKDQEYNDDVYSLYFSKGKFYLTLELCGGYIGTEKIESHISKERVLELIKTHPQL